MKIKLNEKDKVIIKQITAYVVMGIDSIITGAGCGAAGLVVCGTNKKAMRFGLAALIAIQAFRQNGDYYNTLVCDSFEACDWIFNKLENSNQKVIEFEK